MGITPLIFASNNSAIYLVLAMNARLGIKPFSGAFGVVSTISFLLLMCSNKPTFVFLELKAAFDSVGRAVPWYCRSLKGVPEKIAADFKLCV